MPRPPVTPRPPRALRPSRHSHFGRGGALYVLVTLLIAVGAFNSQNNLLYWTFGFALALFLASGVVSGAMLMGVRVEREWVSPAVAGEFVTIRYRVHNRNRLIPAFALTITEDGFDEPSARGAGLLWHRRWLLPARPTVAIVPTVLTPRAFVAHAGPGEAVHAEARVVARRRGPVAFTGFSITTSFPFGLLRKTVHVPRRAGAVVLPRIEDAGADPSRGAPGWAAFVGVSRRPGQGEEFFALREYAHGDSPRDVAWRASAKRGSLLVRQLAAPTPRRLWIVLRLRPRPGSDAADERAIRIAAGLARDAERSGVEYGLAVPLTRLLVPPRRGEGHLSRLTIDLGLLDLGPDDGRGRAAVFPVHALGGSAGRHSTCIVVHSEAIDSSFAPAVPGVTHIVASVIGGGLSAASAVPEPAEGALAA